MPGLAERLERLRHSSRRLRNLPVTRRSVTPTLSVVVPVYNVAPYVGAALQSILDQGYPRLEVVVVDDGSTDDSARIVAAVAGRDSRVKVLRQPNKGLGAARNAGIRAATGKYLAMIDSDDLVEPGAFRRMIEMLEATGSDFAVASYRHLRSGQLFEPGRWIRAIHKSERRAETLRAAPDVLANAIICSKVFRRDFWDRNGLRFPEGVLFEDQEVSTLAYCRASCFDVTDFPLLQWRQRSEPGSITAEVGDPANLQARFDAAMASLAVLESHGQLEAHQARVVDYLANNTFTLNQLVHGDPRYWEVLRAGLEQLWRQARTADIRSRVPVGDKVVYHLVRSGRQRDAIAFVEAGGRRINRWAPVLVDGLLHTAVPLWGDPEIPRWCFEPALTETVLTGAITGVDLVEGRTLRVRGYAYVTNAGGPDGDELPVAELSLVDVRAGIRLPLTTHRRPDARAKARSSHQQIDFTPSGFEATVDIGPLQATFSRKKSSRRPTLQAGVSVAGRVGLGHIEKRLPGTSARALREWLLPDGSALRPTWDASGLTLELRHAGPSLQHALIADGSLVLSIRVPPAFRPVAAEATSGGNPAGKLTMTPGEEAGTVRVLVPMDLVDASSGPLRVDLSDGRRRQAVRTHESHVLEDGTHHVYLRRRQSTRLLISRTGGVAFLEGMRATDTTLFVDVAVPQAGVTGLSLRLTRDDLELRSAVAPVLDHRATLTVPVEMPSDGDEQEGAPPTGRYQVLIEGLRADGTPCRLDAAVREELRHEVPVSVATRDARAKLALTRFNEPYVRIGRPLEVGERAPVVQRGRRERYRGDRTPVRDGIFLQCLNGDQVADSQLAIAYELADQYPSWPVVWAIRDRSVRLPHGHRGVVIGSKRYYEALRRLRVVCVNHELPEYFQKNKGQVVVQTYHGHPFKAMGVARWRAHGASEREIAANLAKRSAWDVLSSPSSVATRLYAEQFPLPVHIAEVGHPRNDRLARSTASERAEIRARLGLGEAQKAVLFAPTYRDAASPDPWASPLVQHLDPEALSEHLGKDYVVILRGHPANGRYSRRTLHARGVLDATFYPDINELIIASDVGVFDYSSIRFDFSVVGRPMVFFVPDREDYFAHLAPLLDYDTTTPGPQVSTLTALVEAIHDAEADRSSWAGEYAKFVTTFNHLDDGRAAERLVSVIMDHVHEAG